MLVGNWVTVPGLCVTSIPSMMMTHRNAGSGRRVHILDINDTS